MAERLSRDRCGLAALTLAATLAVVYAPVVRKLVADCWNNSDYSYAFICVPIAIAIVISRRSRLLQAPLLPSPWGLALAVASLGLLLIGRIGSELFLTRLSLVGCLAGTVLFIGGWRALQLLLPPFGLIVLSIPIPAVIMTRVTLPLQLLASAATEVVLNAARIPVFREGNVLMLPNTTLEVAEDAQRHSLADGAARARPADCAVLRSAPPRPLGQVVAAAVPVAVLVNAMRVSITAMAAYRYGGAAAQGVAHEALGWAMFVAGCGLLWMVAQPRRSNRLPRRNPVRVMTTRLLVLAAAVLCTQALLGAFERQETAPPRAPLQTLPAMLGS